MSELSIKLRKLAIRMVEVRNLMDVKDDSLSVDPHSYPGILTDTMGGPALKTHRPHEYEGPRGIASAEEEDDESEEETD